MKTCKLIVKLLDEPPAGGFWSGNQCDFDGPGFYALQVRKGDHDSNNTEIASWVFGDNPRPHSRYYLLYIVGDDGVEISGAAVSNEAFRKAPIADKADSGPRAPAMTMDPQPPLHIQNLAPVDAIDGSAALILRAIAIANKPELVLDMFPNHNRGINHE